MRVMQANAECGLDSGNAGELPLQPEGYNQAEWILADYGDFLVHIFSPKAREYYDLERLWRSAKTVDIPPEWGDFLVLLASCAMAAPNALAADYVGRAARYCACEMREIRPAVFDIRQHPTAAGILKLNLRRALMDTAASWALVSASK